jgi:hypothetical protein
MSLKRAALCLPVVAGLVLTGSAVARMAPATGEHPAPACERNGVQPNPQRHPSCGLHLGRETADGGPAPAKVCKNHDVRPNRNGHPTCGLHKGWDKHQPAPTTGTSSDAPGRHTHQKNDKPRKLAHAHHGGHAAEHGGKAGNHSH